MDGGVDPSPTLGQEDAEGIGDDGPTLRLGEEHHLPVGESTQKDGGEETIFSEKKEVLLVQSRDDGLAVFLDDLGLDDEGDPVVAALLPRLQPEHGETPWQTRDTTKDGLKGLRVVMGNEVFEDLDRRHPGLAFVRYPSLATNTHDHLIMVHTIDEVLEGVGEHFRVSINLGCIGQ